MAEAPEPIDTTLPEMRTPERIVDSAINDLIRSAASQIEGLRATLAVLKERVASEPPLEPPADEPAPPPNGSPPA